MTRKIETLSDIQSLSRDEAVNFCFTAALLRPQPTCSCGNGPMHLIRDSRKGDGVVWRCPSCQRKLSIRHNSFFSRTKLALERMLLILYFWGQDEPVGKTAEYAGTSTHTVSVVFGHLQDACAIWCDKNQDLIGGPGESIQIDETAMTKRKQNTGRLPAGSQIWAFGGVVEETGEFFCEIVPNRRRETLVAAIEAHVKPGTHIKSDCWPAYRVLQNYKGVSPYSHSTVNHRRNFVSPVDGTNTQKIERMWRDLKEKKKRSNGVPVHYLDAYCKEWTWRRRNIQEKSAAFGSVVELVRSTAWS